MHFLSRSDGSLMARLSVGGGAIVSPPQTTSQGVLIQTGNGNLALIGSTETHRTKALTVSFKPVVARSAAPMWGSRPFSTA